MAFSTFHTPTLQGVESVWKVWGLLSASTLPHLHTPPSEGGVVWCGLGAKASNFLKGVW